MRIDAKEVVGLLSIAAALACILLANARILAAAEAIVMSLFAFAFFAVGAALLGLNKRKWWRVLRNHGSV